VTRASFDPRPIAERFWSRAGTLEEFPRRLTPTIAAILPIPVIFLPRLAIPSIVEWLGRHGVPCSALSGSRRLNGCLLAQRGHGFIFVDGELSEAEQRLTIAHETAHFLYHYEQPRDSAHKLIGPSILAVLDGDRLPTASEKLRGALRDVPVSVYAHTLDRDDEGRPDERIARLETEADLIAFELLAPIAEVRAASRSENCVDVLVTRFGLPQWAAVRWSAWIQARRGGDELITRLLQANGQRSLSKTTHASGRKPG
jgi:hypothetical protein